MSSFSDETGKGKSKKGDRHREGQVRQELCKGLRREGRVQGQALKKRQRQRVSAACVILRMDPHYAFLFRFVRHDAEEGILFGMVSLFELLFRDTFY